MKIRILSHDRVSSTNDLAREAALQGGEEGLVVSARSQTKGRGRRGRLWESAPGCGACFSVVLRPRLRATDAGWLAILGGVSVLSALEGLGVRNVSLKWPNDVLVAGRKIAGVLVEPRLSGERIEFAVVGIGVNVAQQAADWIAPLKEQATSCHMEGVETSCEAVRDAVLKHLGAWYQRLQAGETRELQRMWTERGGLSGVPPID